MLKDSPELVIKAGQASKNYWVDLWRYRELLYFLAWRDLLVRYKQTLIGAMWAFIRPALMIGVLTFVFGHIAKLPSDGVPYPVLVCAAILPWQFFANALSDAGGSLVSNANLISKVYFPRLVVPGSALAVSLVDLAIASVLMFVLMGWYGLWPDWRVLALPFFTLLAVGAAFGAGLWVAALNVKYRDFRYVIPFVVQFGLYVTPVGFSSSIVPDRWRLLYSLNPMVGVIDGFRWALLGGDTALYWPGFLLSTALMVVLIITGVRYFRRTERYFADVI